MKIKSLEQIFKSDPLLPTYIVSIQSIQGGSINDAFKVVTQKRTFFTKVNEKVPEDFFESEANALNHLRNATDIRVPKVVTYNKVENTSYLVLEFIESQVPNSNFEVALADGLFQLHQNSAPSYGWKCDNYIGMLRQQNEQDDDWSSFFIQQRLKPQLNLAKNIVSSEMFECFDELFRRMPVIFKGVKPSLLHGDLWRGNVIADENGNPVLIDPSIYYGIPEMDMAMSMLFGGFNSTLYIRYKKMACWDEDWKMRMKVCNLYPLLVHLNLFGVGYLSSIENTFLELGINK